MRAVKIANGLPLKLAILLMILTGMTFAQSTVLGQNCDLSVMGATDKKSFLAFDQELRSALRTQDATKISTLVKYPLVITSDGGHDYLQSATSVSMVYKTPFHELFTLAIRRAILDQRPDTIWCDYRGIMYGNRVLIDTTGHGFTLEYAIHEIYLLYKTSRTGEVEFACDTRKHRVIVDIGTSGAPRYRAWNRPHSLAEKPDLEMLQGRVDAEGSGVCSTAGWTFTDNTTEIVVSQLGCSDDTHQPPKGAKGSLDVMVSGKKPQESLWCY